MGECKAWWTVQSVSVCNYLAGKKLEVFHEFVVCLNPILVLLN